VTTSFRFAPDILRRLGEELNPGLDQGVLELVKNAYDADARRCEVKLERVGRRGGTVVVRDDGSGMTADQIVGGWLVIGHSGKSTRTRTRLGRVPAGNKGLGRLAALRLGQVAHVTTRPRAEKGFQHSLTIDWAHFENVRLVEDVSLIVNTEARPAGSGQGTEVRIERLRQPIGRMDVKRMARSLILLADPFGDDPTGFEPTLNAPEFSDLERLVTQRYFSDAEFHLSASVDDRGQASATVTDWRGETLYDAGHEEVAEKRSQARYRCPAAQFDLFVFLLSQQVFRLRDVSLAEVRQWLGEFGGVHLYINGLRVSPYGNEGNDWLEMNRKRAGSPEERPSTNTSIGRIQVEDLKERLVQKTDRSGVIEGEAFQDLRAFASDALDWMARRRLETAEARRRGDRQKASSGAARQRNRLASEISDKAADPEKALELLDKYDRARDREARDLRREVQLYRTLATAGITAATVAHETEGSPFKIISSSISSLETRIQKAMGEAYGERFAKPIYSIKRALSSLASLSTATLRLVDHEKRRAGRVMVHQVIDDLLDTYDPFLAGRDVKARTYYDPSAPFLRGSEAAVESIFTNLLNNSLAIFEMAKMPEREILITTEVVGEIVQISYSDNGPGITGISLRSIWLPGETTRPNGTGLGLTIVRDTVADLGGTVNAFPHGRMGGAEFVVELPILGN
jgi:C4-dicarboxylate-specific signal transduction histidine kinase